MRRCSAKLRFASFAVALWQLAALSASPLILSYGTRSGVAPADARATDCPVCDHQIAPGASCPMHSAQSRDTSEGSGACALTSTDNLIQNLFSLTISAGVPVVGIQIDWLTGAEPLFLLGATLLSDFSRLPSTPPPRG